MNELLDEINRNYDDALREVSGMSEMEEQLQLSIIYVRLLRDLEDLTGVAILPSQQAIQLVSDAMDEAHDVKLKDSDYRKSLCPYDSLT